MIFSHNHLHARTNTLRSVIIPHSSCSPKAYLTQPMMDSGVLMYDLVWHSPPMQTVVPHPCPIQITRPKIWQKVTMAAVKKLCFKADQSTYYIEMASEKVLRSPRAWKEKMLYIRLRQKVQIVCVNCSDPLGTAMGFSSMPPRELVF